MIICEQCGNEFQRGRIVKKEDKEFIQCPYCDYHNKRVYRKKNKKRANKYQKRRNKKMSRRRNIM